jgi:hypothetical protein
MKHWNDSLGHAATPPTVDISATYEYLGCYDGFRSTFHVETSKDLSNYNINWSYYPTVNNFVIPASCKNSLICIFTVPPIAYNSHLKVDIVNKINPSDKYIIDTVDLIGLFPTLTITDNVIYQNINYLGLSSNLNSGLTQKWAGEGYGDIFYVSAYFRFLASDKHNFSEAISYESANRLTCLSPNPLPNLYKCMYPKEMGSFDFIAVEYRCHYYNGGYRECREQRATCPVTWPLSNLGTATIISSCGVGSATVTTTVNGGATPYEKYTWYKQIGSGNWSIDYEQICPLGGCNNSHVYTLSGQTINTYLRVEDTTGAFWASNILSVNCTNKNKCGIDTLGGLFCSASGTGGSCNNVSDCCHNGSDCGICKKR